MIKPLKMALTFTNNQTFWLFFSIPPIITFQDIFTTSTFLPLGILLGLFFIGLFIHWVFSSQGGPAWKNGRAQMGRVPIPGPKGLPLFGSLFSLSHGLAHQTLATMAEALAAKQLMALSLGSTSVVVTSDPEIAREILTSPYFADRPIKQSAKQLMFSRAIGFAPSGTHWRLLRRIAASHLFSPRQITSHEGTRMLECTTMVNSIFKEQVMHGGVSIRKHLQEAALNNIMGSVFGKRYDFAMQENKSGEATELQELVKEGFELLGAFNWSDHLPWLKNFCDPSRIVHRCSALVPCVQRLVRKIIEEHKERRMYNCNNSFENLDFVDVLLSLDGEEKLDEDDMIAVLWEMIFRGTDTIALTIEWIIAAIILNPTAQSKLEHEVSTAIANGVSISAIAKLPYLQALVKETLRLHPPGPLLSWARLSNTDVQLSNGMVVPKGTTTMVNMWSITHDLDIWENPSTFNPERFLQNTSNATNIDIDVRGSDLRLAPFGAGRRVCPGKDLALVTVSQWVAMLVYKFKWVQHDARPVDLSEKLKLSCEMKHPLSAVAIPRNCFVENITS